MLVGAHVSNAGGISNAVDRAAALGAEALQCFCSSPRGWAFKPVPDEQAAAFRQKASESGIGASFLHGIYLVTVATQDEALLQRGLDSLTKYMHVASAMGATGVIFHSGSHKGVGYDAVFEQAVTSLKQVLDATPPDTFLIMENSAGMGDHICSKFSEIGGIIKAVDNPRLKVCLDTQHCFAAGHDVTKPEGVAAMMDEFDHEIGVDRLAAVHANDSKTPLASAVDRHENLGQGQMGEDAFVAIMGHPAFRDVPFILEVPGLENNGPDKPNMDLLKELRGRARLSG